MTPAENKRFATLQARLALRGYVLVRSTDDNGGPLYIVSRWALTKQMAGLSEVEQFAERVAPAFGAKS